MLSEKQNIQSVEGDFVAAQGSSDEPSVPTGPNIENLPTPQCEGEMIASRSQFPGFVSARQLHQQRSQLENDYNAVTAAMLQLPALLQTAIDRLPVASNITTTPCEENQMPTPLLVDSNIKEAKAVSHDLQVNVGDPLKIPQQNAGAADSVSLKAVKQPVCDVNIKISKVPPHKSAIASSSVRDTSSIQKRGAASHAKPTSDDEFGFRFEESSDDQGACSWWRSNFVRGDTLTERNPFTFGIVEGDNDDCVFVSLQKPENPLNP